jgi:hypothetical protein
LLVCELAGGVKKLEEHGTVTGLEPASLGRLQPLVGESKLVDDPQRLAR